MEILSINTLIDDWHLISGIVTTLVGIGIVWGKTSSKLKILKTEVDALETALQVHSSKTDGELKELSTELKQMNATLTELSTLMKLITSNRLKKGDE